MRHVFAAAFLSVIAFSPANAATGHWYCTGDGIKSWTSDAAASDAHGWKYDGDRAAYHDKGHCKAAM
jgi:hypothetical protein